MSDADFAKTHLREHLTSILIPPVSKGFWSIYDTAKELCERNGQPDQILRTFQNMLTKIPEWSESTLSTETERIITTTKCSYLDDLVMGVFIAYMKAFASLHYRGNSAHVSVDFERPSMSKFIHEVYIQSARKLWQVAYLFKTVGVPSEQQARNRQEIERILNESFEIVIRSFLPWKSIAKQFSEAPTTEEPPAPPTPQRADTPAPRRVLFDEEDSSDDDTDTEAEESENEAPPQRLQIGDEDATISIDGDEEEEKKDVPQELEVPDLLKEIESKASSDSSLVLNL